MTIGGHARVVMVRVRVRVVIDLFLPCTRTLTSVTAPSFHAISSWEQKEKQTPIVILISIRDELRSPTAYETSRDVANPINFQWNY